MSMTSTPTPIRCPLSTNKKKTAKIARGVSANFFVSLHPTSTLSHVNNPAWNGMDFTGRTYEIIQHEWSNLDAMPRGCVLPGNGRWMTLEKHELEAGKGVKGVIPN